MPSTRRIFATLGMGAALTLAMSASIACSGAESQEPVEAPKPSEALAQITEGPHPVAVFDLGDLGIIRAELLPEIAPKNVAHFTALANQGHFDGTYFHRVIPGFMIQGGDPHTRNTDPRDDGAGRSPTPVDDELSDYPQTRGTLSMAKSGGHNSGGGQFFFVHGDSPHLNGHYTTFGRIISGVEVVDNVTELELDIYGRFGPPNRPYPVNATLTTVRVEPAEASVALEEDSLPGTSREI